MFLVLQEYNKTRRGVGGGERRFLEKKSANWSILSHLFVAFVCFGRVGWVTVRGCLKSSTYMI